MSKLEKQRDDLQATISTLQKMSIGVPEQILQNSEQLAGIVEVLGEVHNFTLQIQEMSRAIKRMHTQSEGNLQPL
jgi:hypothetical protein